MIVSGVDPELARKAYVVFQMLDKDKSGDADEDELKKWLQVPCNMCQNARFLEPPTCNMPICTLPGAIS